MNLNGDYLSDALAAQVGGIGIAPGGNINYVTGHAVFEATHGTAPKYANLDKVNPGSVILSGEMMLRYMGWTEAADRSSRAMDTTIGQQDRHLRLRPPDGRRDRGQVQRVRRRPDRQHVTRGECTRPIRTRAIRAGRCRAADDRDASSTYNFDFRAVTQRAPPRFDAARLARQPAPMPCERIELYDQSVNRTVAALREQSRRATCATACRAGRRSGPSTATPDRRHPRRRVHQDLLQFDHATALRDRRRRPDASSSSPPRMERAPKRHSTSDPAATASERERRARIVAAPARATFGFTTPCADLEADARLHLPREIDTRGSAHRRRPRRSSVDGHDAASSTATSRAYVVGRMHGGDYCCRS